MSAETMPLALGEWEFERGSEWEDMEGLDEPEATDNPSRVALGSDLGKVEL